MKDSEAKAMVAAIMEMTAQRDEARWLVCEMQARQEQGTPEGWAEEFGWGYLIAKRNEVQADRVPETTTLTCPFCDYREVVHGKPSPSDHSPCAFCNMRDHGDE
jgi:hypothetical protein